MSLGHVVDLLTSQAWAMHKPTLQALRDIVVRHEGGVRLSPAEADDAVLAAGGTPRRPARPFEVVGDVAVIPVQGVIARRSSSVNGSSQPRGTSIEQLEEHLSAALADDKVRSILLDVDSPGGSVSGVPEFAAKLRGATKPVTAFTDGMMASAAYWIASSAQRIVASRAATVGSIGVYAVLDDLHRLYESRGVDAKLIASGPRKGGGVPGTHVTDEHVAELRETVQSFADMFFADIGAARGLDGEDLSRATTGQAWVGERGLELRLIDAIGTREDVLAALAETATEDGAGTGDLVAATEPRAQSRETRETNMDLKTLDAATLRAQRPDLVEQIEKAAASAATTTAGDAAVKAERDRVSAIIRSAAKAGVDAETQAKAIAEGWSREKAAESFLDIAAERKEARLEQIRETTPKATTVGDPAGVTVHKEGGAKPEGAKSAADVAAMPMGVERFKAEFASDAKAQEEFVDEATYVAVRKCEEGLVGAS